jgi:ribulose-5-phosphate 4-epimerase/fuculose-1-phosphate aldolase
MATESELKETVAQSCRILAQHGLVKGSTGHVSTRVPGRDEILIRGRPEVDQGLRFAEPDSIIHVDLNGKVVGATGGVRRVGEIYIHTEMYKRRPDVNAVIHAHPPGVLLCTMAGVKIRPIFGGYEPPGMRMALEGLPLYERSITLHTLEETIPFLDVMGSKDVCLMRAHGIAVSGRSVEEATHTAIVLETLARLNWYASMHGAIPEISDEDKTEFTRRRREEPREDGGDGGWAYLLKLLEMPGQFDDTGLGFRM